MSKVDATLMFSISNIVLKLAILSAGLSRFSPAAAARHTQGHVRIGENRASGQDADEEAAASWCASEDRPVHVSPA